MQSTCRVLALALLTVCALAFESWAGTAEVVTKAAKVIKAGQAAPLPTKAAEIKGKAAELKGKAVSALGTLPADAAKAWAGSKAQASFTPEQMNKVQAQAAQAFSTLAADPKVAAVAAQAGVTGKKLEGLQAQTAAAVAGFKGPDGKVSVEAAAQQAQQFMKSEPGTKLQGQAKEAVSTAKPFLNKLTTQTDERGTEKKGILSPENIKVQKEKAAKAASNFDPATAASSIQARAELALVKFCKKYEGKAEAPARCRKAKPAAATE